MTEKDDFAELMTRLQRGDDDAAAQLFHRYHRQLCALARQRLNPALRQKLDPDDVIQSVYKSFFHRCEQGQFQIESWDSLWTLLTLITIRKCANRVDYFLAACRSVQREVPPTGDETGQDVADYAVAAEPTPDEAALLTETIEQVMRGMQKWECEVLTLSLQGYSIPEISQQISRAERTVERVRERIKKRLLRL